MKNRPAFLQEYHSAASSLIESQAVKEPYFSRGTYQVEVQEKGKKKAFSFLQMKDDGELTDFFCTCKVSESGHGCPHLAASYLRIFNGFDAPLHVRFKESLWSRLFQIQARRQGYSTQCLLQEGALYFCESETHKRLFSIEPLTAAAKERLAAVVSGRVVETEETSIKFSNLSAEEIGEYRAGKASHSLQFELSFWADLAKWVMALDDEKAPYEMLYSGTPLPSEIRIQFPELVLWFYVSEANWPSIIPALETVHSPLKVCDKASEAIEAIQYDEKACSLHIQQRYLNDGLQRESEGYPVGEWLYVEGKGFYKKRPAPLFEQGLIPKERIAAVLTQSARQMQPFLPIDLEPRKARYRLFFDPAEQLHIELYVFEPGDMSLGAAACFTPWVYVPKKGFFLIEDWLFEGKERVIAKSEMADFINRHRIWLHQFPGFQTHLGSLESHLTFRFEADGTLFFDAELNFPEEDTLNFEEWAYIKGQGFYMKKESRGRLPLHPGLRISPDEISSFISNHKEELEQVNGFFSSEPLIVRLGLKIGINKEGHIAIDPKLELAPGILESQVQMYGDYLFAAGKGFTSLPLSSRLPEKFREKAIVPSFQEASFLAYELEALRPFIIEIDARLSKPSHMQLKIRKIVRDRKKRRQDWLVDLVYSSEMGSIDIFSIWDAFQEKQRHLFSPAGLLILKEPRYNWIRQLTKRRLDRKRGFIRLNTLEWIRLNGFEEVQEPKGTDPESVETRAFLEELKSLEAHRLLDMSRLKATLRPYQEQGVHWLWFLYCHGLSGLLCDDMGLGKTHQTMALLAAVVNEDEEKRNKYLVVCPTSVIYHWQELLKRFLPEIRVCTYYGLARSLERFEPDFDLLLTSYGILRTGRENLRSIPFEVAIFDEIQVAKNHTSQTHKALQSINAQMRLGLTGTPIENRIRELKSLFDIVLPSYMPPEAVFRDLFVGPIEKQADEEKKALLNRLVRPFILRRKKSEVLRDLPEKIEEISYCDLSPEQKDLYREIALQMRDTLYRELGDETKPISYVHVFSALSSLKQICDHPCLVSGELKDYRFHESGKWDLFVELLEEARGSGQKIVVFSQYLGMLSIIEMHLKRKGIGFATIKGSTRDRSEQLRKFREDPACEVFVASLLAAGVGIDLTVASIVIHYDRWWNPAKESQATDRVHRIGQNRGVQVFKLVTKGTIEEHIHELIERKRGLLESIIGAEDQINYLTREELLEVFEKIYIRPLA